MKQQTVKVLCSALLLIAAHAEVNGSITDESAAPSKFLAASRDSGISDESAAPSKFLAASQNSGTPSLDMTTAAMEAALTDLMLGKTKFGATPMGGSLKTIENLITKDMMPKVIAAHNMDQKTLIRLAKEIKQCGSIKTGSLRKADPPRKNYLSNSRLHQECRQSEAVLYSSKDACMIQQRALYKEKVLRCNYFATVSKTYGTQKANAAIVKKAGSENVEQYLRRISGTICGNHVHGEKGLHSKKGGWGGGLPNSFLDKYLQAKEKCKRAKDAYNTKVKECKRKYDAYKVKRGKCNQYQALMDQLSCKHAVMVKDTCESYAGCYYSKRNAYKLYQRQSISQETDRKAEWRGLKRMECLMKAFSDGKVTNAEVDACKKKTHSTKHLILSYPKIPPLANCGVPNLYPATGAYKRREFAPLPTLAKGLECAPCAGMDAVPTKPRDGSPRGAKCARVSLLGYYSPGALIKCTNGIDARRSKDKNSCPRGTKIFSPATRSDWKTFLASAGPLRAPHWIVDVTRPSNGCGGCRGNPMNSQNRNQKTWRTSDGSPWWLRSSGYNEPNGDYSANCFLDLWHGRPRNENYVSFNDGKCNYHSKSYYCQPIYFRLKPKSGSPKSCMCSKVDLSSKYLAGALVKCEQCIDVRRSTQKNSCPNGMKIFSPASRADWKTFLSSAGPLRAPDWIIDVTRPQNGCGGCKKHSMKSSTPQQATWRTSDGSPWWLRSTRYNEPNGDYHGNCFMSMASNPTSPDTLRFNDHNCNKHSRSYYCQPTRRNKNYGGHHRRRREQPQKPKPKVKVKATCDQANCGYGLESCKELAQSLGLQLGGAGYSYSGNYQTTGCYSYRSGVYFGRAYYGYVNAMEVTSEAQLTSVSAPKYRLECTCLKVPFGVVQDFDQRKLFSAGWKVWKDVPYKHHTVRKDIQPTSGECVMWGSKKSSGSTSLELAAFGRRKVIENKKTVWENGVYWYTQTPKGYGSNGFAPNDQLSLKRADTNNNQSELRLSWNLHAKAGGYRSGQTKGLKYDGTWRKVVMYGPCTGVIAGKR